MLSRSFNTVELDSTASKVRKSSKQTDKLEKEVFFYLKAPDSVKTLMPKLLGYAEDFSWYDTEYLDLPTLGEVYATREVKKAAWPHIFEQLDPFFGGEPLTEGSDCDLYEVFIEKAVKRSTLISSKALYKIFYVGSEINNKTYPSLVSLIKAKSGILQRVPTACSVLHGDLCFSNILFNEKSGIVRLIDPRGGFTEPSITGPIVYDIAKLSQSIYGGYDQILHSRYKLKRSDSGAYSLEIARAKSYKDAALEFEKLLLQSNITKDDAVILAGLMLSGTPTLHVEDVDRAISLALQSVLLLSGETKWT